MPENVLVDSECLQIHKFIADLALPKLIFGNRPETSGIWNQFVTVVVVVVKFITKLDQLSSKALIFMIYVHRSYPYRSTSLKSLTAWSCCSNFQEFLL